MSVSIASSWQKKKRFSRSSVLRQCSRRDRVTLVTPGYPWSRHSLIRGRMAFTSRISWNSPGSSNVFDVADARMYPAGRLPETRENSFVWWSYSQCSFGSS